MKEKNHLDELIARRPELESCRESILAAAAAMKKCFADGGKLLICGNGGSGADAEHWAGELLKRFCKIRPLPAGLPPELAAELEGALLAIPLTSFSAFQSAWANDRNPDFNFAQLVNALGRRGDVLIGLSTSGSAKNVNHAVATGKAFGLKTVALTGSEGGALAAAADIAIKVPEKETFKVQELHLPIYHCICLMLDA
jgi:D-sedoheptulose 7-phosphate isomerase